MRMRQQRINIIGIKFFLVGLIRILQHSLTEKLLIDSDRAFMALRETLQRSRYAVKEPTIQVHNGYSLLML